MINTVKRLNPGQGPLPDLVLANNVPDIADVESVLLHARLGDLLQHGPDAGLALQHVNALVDVADLHRGKRVKLLVVISKLQPNKVSINTTFLSFIMLTYEAACAQNGSGLCAEGRARQGLDAS